MALAETLLLKLLGSAPEVTFRPAFFIFAHGGYVYLLALLALLLWRRTRPFVLAGRGVVIWCAAAWVAAMACGTAYVLNPTFGLLPAWLALPIAAVLASWRRWRPASSIVLAAGLALGILLAQAFYTFPFQDAYDQFVSPLWGFVPPVTLAVIVALALCLRRPAHSDAGWLRKLVGHWGLMGSSIACVVFSLTELGGVRVREVEPAGSRILNDWAYDVTITGEPPQLVWTDRQRIQVLTDAYGNTHERYTLDDEYTYYVQRIWPSPVGGFHLDAMDMIDWWDAPAPGERLSHRPTARYRVDSWLRQRGTDSSSVWTLAEDPVRRRLFMVSEYYSHYAFIDQDGGEITNPGTISNSIWAFWHFTADPTKRALYATSALYDGGLHEMNLDTLTFSLKASDLYLYETVLDGQHNLLWGIRPLTGEIIAVDTTTYALRHRVPVQFGLRDLQRDPVSGDLFTCSEFFGDVFRIDGQTRAATRIGWCGRLCRSMFLDTQRDMLWVATRDGICRIPTS